MLDPRVGQIEVERRGVEVGVAGMIFIAVLQRTDPSEQTILLGVVVGSVT